VDANPAQISAKNSVLIAHLVFKHEQQNSEPPEPEDGFGVAKFRQLQQSS
jgi:hypothetical protein